MNPLLEKFNTPFETMPFNKLKNEHFIEALDVAIERARKEYDEIKATKSPNFENVVEAFDSAGRLVATISGLFFNLHSAETNNKMTEIAKEISPKLSSFRNDIILDEDLFSHFQTVYEKKDFYDLSQEQVILLDKFYKQFVRNGALLSTEQKDTLREIDIELSKLSVDFSDNLLQETNNYKLVIDSREDLLGLPEDTIKQAAKSAQEKGLEGKWIFTLDYTSLSPFITYSQRRNLREAIVKANGSKCFLGNERDNREIVKRLACLRHERALLLGYPSHAHFVLEERMATSPEKVDELAVQIKAKAKGAAEADINEIRALAKKDGINDLQSWDYSFYAEKLKKERFNIDDELMRPYFQLENVIEGVFGVAKKLYGLEFIERGDIPIYHLDVKTYEVVDENGKFVSVLYADFFPRPGKRSGAWMTEYRGQWKEGDKDIRPHVSIVCNFTRPSDLKPSLLTFNEVTTLFHEFGHALHGMLSDVRYETLSGTSVFWDFVELPSQILENWAYEKECLDLFAKHYETGSPIPSEMVEKIKESANFQEGRQTMRQLSLGVLDMAWHRADPSQIQDIEAFEIESTKGLNFLPHIEGTCVSCSFGHIFAGGYSAGYYSYKWAEVLDADAFSHFKENGIFNREIATKFKEHVLSKGGSEHPMELYKKFRGQAPSIDPLLKRAGLI